MGKINLLDISVANLIAAGEVVERPASAVKEMLENSIDAGSTAITVEIKNGGISLIRITDNGCGMSREDATVCIKRHATSKIKTAADLDGIVTLGFRGEALAAISSVSHMRVMTRTADSEIGTVMECDAGEIISVEDSGCPVGTTVIVEELFANVPARRKFLRRDVTETAAVAAVVEKIALSRPDISFKFIADGNMKFHTAGDGNLLNVIYAVLGRDFAKKTVKVHDMTESVEIEGFIGTPENCRGNRNYENFFLNGRYVKCQTASAAIEQAFSSYIPSDKFPCCVMYITINPVLVDVNVHPQKMEIKFSNEKPVFNAVYCAVRNALMNRIERPSGEGEVRTRLTGDSYKLYEEIIGMKTDSDSDAAKIASDKEKLSAKYEQVVIPRTVSYVPKVDSDTVKIDCIHTETPPDAVCRTEMSKSGTVDIIKDGCEFYNVPIDSEIAKENVQKTANEKSETDNSENIPWFRVVGVTFECYVFVELEDRMLVIDKHAAHERILFEKLKANLYSTSPTSQLLLIPIDVNVSPTEYAAVCEYRAEMGKIGFVFTSGKDNGTVSLLQYPAGLTHVQAHDLFEELAARLSDGTGDVQTSRDVICEQALYQASCKAAVKGGKTDSPENIEWIVRQVLTRNDIRYCPHGRPVAFEITKNRIEKRFERT